MHKADSMPYLVRCYITERFAHDIIVKYGFSYTRVYSACLYQTPVVQQRYYIMIPDNISCQNFTATRVNITWSHSISNTCSCIFYTTIAHIIRVKIRIIFRIIFSYNSIFKSGSFECLLPVLHSLTNNIAPFIRKRRIHIEYNRFYRLYQFTSEISILIFRLKSPTMYICFFVNFIGITCIYIFTA